MGLRQTAQINFYGQAVLTIVAGTTVVHNGHPVVLLDQGTRKFTGSYSGDSNFTNSTSAALGLTVS